MRDRGTDDTSPAVDGLAIRIFMQYVLWDNDMARALPIGVQDFKEIKDSDLL